MLVEADLAPELTSAEEVNIQEEEAVIAKKIHYQRALRFAMPCYGLAIILSFIGLKMIIAPFYHIESLVSLIVIGGVLALSVVLSIMFPDKEKA